MNPYVRYPLVLLLVASVSGVSLYGTYTLCAPYIARQERLARQKAFDKVFTDGYQLPSDPSEADVTLADLLDAGASTASLGDGGILRKDEVDAAGDPDKAAQAVLYTKVWKEGADPAGDAPDYYAVEGEAIGYNSSVPIRVLAGFTNPDKKGKDGTPLLVGWCVLASEETPGLGEKAKDQKATRTWAQIITFQESTVDDRRTDFQRSFTEEREGGQWKPREVTASELKLAKDGGKVDIITGATYSSVGVIHAIQNAGDRLQAFLEVTGGAGGAGEGNSD